MSILNGHLRFQDENDENVNCSNLSTTKTTPASARKQRLDSDVLVDQVILDPNFDARNVSIGDLPALGLPEISDPSREDEKWWEQTPDTDDEKEGFLQEDEAQFKSGAAAMQQIEQDEMFDNNNDSAMDDVDDWQHRLETEGLEIFVNPEITLSPATYFRQFSAPFTRREMIEEYPGFKSPEKKRDPYEMVPFRQEECVTPVMEATARMSTRIAAIPEVAEQHGLAKMLAYPCESLFKTKKLGYSPGKSVLDRESKVYLRNKFEKRLFDTPNASSAEVLGRSAEDPPAPESVDSSMHSQLQPEFRTELRIPIASKEICFDCDVGQVVTWQVPLAHEGDVAIELSSSISCDSDFNQEELYVQEPAAVVVGPGQDCRLTVVFQPSKPVDLNGRLVLFDSFCNEYILPLKAKAKQIGPLKCVKPAIEFGGLPVGSCKYLRVALHNVTKDDLWLHCEISPRHQPPVGPTAEGVILSRLEAMSAFKVLDSCRSVLCPAESVINIELSFEPEAVARYRASLKVRCSKYDAVYSMALIGYGGRARVLTSTKYIKLKEESLTPKGYYEEQLVLRNAGDRTAIIRPRLVAGVALVPDKAQIAPKTDMVFSLRYKHFARKDTKLDIAWSDLLIYKMRNDLRARENGFGLNEESGVDGASDKSLHESTFVYPELDTTMQRQRRLSEFAFDHCDVGEIYEKQLEKIPIYIELDTEGSCHSGWSVSKDKVFLKRKPSSNTSSSTFYISNTSSSSLIFVVEPYASWLSCSPVYNEVQPNSYASVTVTGSIDSQGIRSGESLHAQLQVKCISNATEKSIPVEFDPRATEKSESTRIWFAASSLEFKPTRIRTHLTDSVKLKNKETRPVRMRVKVRYDGDTSPEQFQIRTKHKVITLKPRSYIRLPVMFAPTIVGNFRALLTIRTDDGRWDYMYLYGSGIGNDAIMDVVR